MANEARPTVAQAQGHKVVEGAEGDLVFNAADLSDGILLFIALSTVTQMSGGSTLVALGASAVGLDRPGAIGVEWRSMSTARHLHYTYSDYLSVEAHGSIKHEFRGGEIYAMAGGTPEHGALAARAIAVLTRVLPSCTILSSDVRVRMDASDLTTYPDASAVCGRVARAAEDAMAITNPTLLVEVTSPSTEDYDRGEKLSCYQRIESLKVVLLISHREPRITVWRRDGGRWMASEALRGERVEIPGASFEVDEVFSALDGMR